MAQLREGGRLVASMPGMTVRSRLLGCCACVVFALAGCSSGDAADSSAPAVDGGPSAATPEPTLGSSPASPESSQRATGAPEDGGPLTALPPCPPPPSPVDADVPGLVLPDGAVVTNVEDQGPLVVVQAYVEQTPVQVRQFYQSQKGLELSEIEDEVYEAETLFSGAKYNSYVKAQAKCDLGSLLFAYVGPGNSGDLPSIGGS